MSEKYQSNSNICFFIDSMCPLALIQGYMEQFGQRKMQTVCQTHCNIQQRIIRSFAVQVTAGECGTICLMISLENYLFIDCKKIPPHCAEQTSNLNCFIFNLFWIIFTPMVLILIDREQSLLDLVWDRVE